jgi:hypothetical protein
MKQLDTATKTIGDNVFYIKPFPAFKAANISGQLFALLGPLVGPALAGGGEEESDTESALDKEITGALSSVSGDQIELMLKSLLTRHGNIHISIDGAAEILTEDLANEVFCGELQDMFILAAEVIKVNFRGFFGRLGSLSGVREKLAAAGIAPSTKNTEI